MNTKNRSNILTPRVILSVLLFIVFLPMLPLIISQRWNWWEAWAYAGISILGFTISRVVAGRRNPGLLKERASFLNLPDAAAWDKKLSPLIGLGGGLIPIVIGIEARVSGPDQYNRYIEAIALIVFVAGYVLGSYALYANPFFSGMVRIQTERNHHLIDKGPYRWVRHPGYASALMTYFATPILLGCLWGFLPVALLIIILIIRTRLEDNFLQESLPGYEEFTRIVRYRLLPGVW